VLDEVVFSKEARHSTYGQWLCQPCRLVCAMALFTEICSLDRLSRAMLRSLRIGIQGAWLKTAFSAVRRTSSQRGERSS
jgi:hypothetical protein